MSKTGRPESELASAIADASRSAFSGLFQEHPGNYYYCTLVTTGEAHPPVVAAWSVEALAAAVAERDDPSEALEMYKWSYADSPFYCYGEEFFAKVNDLFSERVKMSSALSIKEWMVEYEFRLKAMECAIRKLDSEGLFGIGEGRLGMAVLVEVMPPDSTNTERALRLNPREALSEWLTEAAEPI